MLRPATRRPPPDTAVTGWLHACGLAHAWAGLDAFQILDTAFGDGQRWRDALAAWRADPSRPRMLHYAALQAPSHAGHAAHAPEAEREEFDAGAVLLTRFTGELAAGLRALRMNADLLLVRWPDSIGDAPAPATPATHAAPELSTWTAKLLARCCHRGTRLFAERLPEAAQLALAQQGFEAQSVAADACWLGHYNPRWEPKTPKLPAWSDTREPSSGQLRPCVVIGAGLAGASTAYALSRRGWAVQVLDAELEPAQGASSLPLGLMAAHTSADDSPRSRLTRAGVKMSLRHAERFLTRGEEWDQPGVLTLKPGAAPHFQQEGAWIKPQALVKAWLAQTGIAFQGGIKVAALQWKATRSGVEDDTNGGGEWRVLNADGDQLARAPLVVLAAAGGCTQLLQQTFAARARVAAVPPLTLVPGQVSWGCQLPGDIHRLPVFAVNGLGYLAANVPINGELAWLLGATFEDEARPLEIGAAHGENFARLQQLLPGAADALQTRFDSGALNAWRNLRCATADRLPITGPVVDGAGKPLPGLWLNTGFGARGLTWSVLCAELLAARLHHEPWPVAAALAAKLDYRV